MIFLIERIDRSNGGFRAKPELVTFIGEAARKERGQIVRRLIADSERRT